MKNWRRFGIPYVYRQRTDVQPFAGVYPTRWAVVAKYSKERAPLEPNIEYGYVGKPNTTVARFVRNLLQTATGGYLKIAEFDRGGVHAIADRYFPADRSTLNASNWTEAYRFYYPWLLGRGEMITQWCNIMHRLPIVFKRHRAIAYHTLTAENVVVDSWQEHKTWLENANISWGKPPSISTKLNPLSPV